MTDRPHDHLDDLDEEILAELRAAWTAADPPPADLDARVSFALALSGLDVEVARLQQETYAGSGARAVERTRTITFDCDSLSLMISVSGAGTGVRVDGWLAPPGRCRVELRTAPAGPDGQDVTYAVEADESGRFVVTGVPHGLAQLVVHTSGRTVVTPSIVL